MCGPGLGAIIATTQIAKESFSTLRLNTLGVRRFYLWALFLPTLLVIAAGVLTVLFGIAQFDPEFNLMRASMKNAPGAQNISPWVVILAQTTIAILIAPFFNVLFALGEELGWRSFLLPRRCHLGNGRTSS